jgi:hypothetical protein
MSLTVSIASSASISFCAVVAPRTGAIRSQVRELARGVVVCPTRFQARPDSCASRVGLIRFYPYATKQRMGPPKDRLLVLTLVTVTPGAAGPAETQVNQLPSKRCRREGNNVEIRGVTPVLRAVYGG